jgi:hypothetical protein
MDKGKDFENILNDCLDRLISGETIESCLARYPEHAAELEPLLKTALEARLAATLQPRAEFRQRAGIEFQKAISEIPLKAPERTFKWQLRWVIPLAVFLVLFSSGAGTVVAATNSLPGSPLYGLKLATEQVQLALTLSSEGKAELYAKFVDYRVAEIVNMAEEGKYEQVAQVTERMDDQLFAMADLNIGGLNQSELKDMFAFEALSSGEQAAPSTTAPTVANVPTSLITIPAPTTNTTSTPPVVVTQAPATTTIVTAPPAPERSHVEDTSMLSDIERLKLLLRERYEQNLQILLEQLEKAPEALKPALQEAIDVLQQGYELAIASLG